MKTAGAFPSRSQLGAAFGSPGISRIPAMTPGTEGPRERMRSMRSGEGTVLALSQQRAVFFFLFPQRKKDKEEVYLCPVILSLF